jgi:hypothetical protein
LEASVLAGLVVVVDVVGSFVVAADIADVETKVDHAAAAAAAAAAEVLVVLVAVAPVGNLGVVEEALILTSHVPLAGHQESGG